jgi:hypothetical protein
MTSGSTPRTAPGAAARRGRARRSPGRPSRRRSCPVHVAGQAPHDRLEDPAAVERQARDQVERPTMRLATARAPTAIRSGRPAARAHSKARPAPTAIEVSGPTTDDHELLHAGCPRLAIDRGHAAEEVQRDRGDRVAVVRAIRRGRPRGASTESVEDHRERQAGDVLPGTEAGLGLLDAGAHDHRDQAGDQEPGARDEYVDCPRSADRKCPGGRGARARGVRRCRLGTGRG